MPTPRRLVVAVTGASGALYAVRFLRLAKWRQRMLGARPLGFLKQRQHHLSMDWSQID